MAEDSAPGWDAIDSALAPLYGTRAPKHYGTLVPYRLGGPDPLHGISAYFNEGPTPHWHYVSYGLTELWAKESPQPEVSGFGFELTFRLAVAKRDDAPPLWPLGLLQQLARYVFQTGNHFEAGHHMGLNGPLALTEPTGLTAVAFLADPLLPVIKGPFGAFEFLQVFGLHAEELEVVRAWNTHGLLQLLAKRDPLLITRLDRASVRTDPALAEEITRRTREEGSSTGSLFVPVVRTEKATWGEGWTLTLSAIAVDDVKRLLEGRIPFGRGLTLVAGDPASGRVRFEPAERTALEVRDGLLHVRLTREDTERLIQTLVARRGTVTPLPGLEVAIVPTEIKDDRGQVVRVVG